MMYGTPAELTEDDKARKIGHLAGSGLIRSSEKIAGTAARKANTARPRESGRTFCMPVRKRSKLSDGGLVIMHVRKLGAALGTVAFLAVVGLTQAASPATAAPAGDTVIAGVTDFRDFKKGYRDGFRDGWEMARDECEKTKQFAFKFDQDESDYTRGYDKGFDRGFEKGWWEYCDD